MINLSIFEIRKMKLEGTWCTEDIDNEHLQLRVFSTAEKNSFLNEQFYLSELQQISWCISTKQQYGTVSDLNFADYENVFDYSFDFTSKRVDKNLERKIRLCFNKLSKYKKLPVVYLIIYHRYLNETKWYLQGHFYFHWLEIQQVGEVLEKISNEIAKKQSNSY